MMLKQAFPSYGFLLSIVCILAVGAALRLYMLPEQILIDDEWHGINFVLGKKFWDVMTSFETSDNSSPPLNLYYLFLYHTFGWSEFTLRLPSVVAGLLSLIILPFLLKNIFNERVGLCFASLLAISPFLVFYARFARAYSIIALLCFWFVLLFYHWLTDGKNRYAVASVVVGSLSVYVHLFSFPTVFAPIITAFGLKAYDHFHKKSPRTSLIAPSLRSLIVVTIFLIALISLLLLPALLKVFQLPWTKGKITLQSFLTAATLISGTANPYLTAIFFLLSVGGIALLIKKGHLLGWIFITVVCTNVIALLVARPNGMDTAIVLLRYMIVVIPLALNGVAVMTDFLLFRIDQRLPMSRLKRILPMTVIAAFTGLCFAAGPLPETYVSTINFSNHSTFQGSYKLHTWDRSEGRHVYPSFIVKRDQIPAFYSWLKDQKQVDAIIEYPYDICNFNNLLYFYQYFHKKRVFAGYCRDPHLLGFTLNRKDNLWINDYLSINGRVVVIRKLLADEILYQVTDPQKLLFHNMVDIADIYAIYKSQADFVVLHKFIMTLKIIPDRMDSLPVYYNSVVHFEEQFRHVFGPPVFEDSQIICFRIR